MKEAFDLSSLPNPPDHYELEEKLGSGIFGEVYKAVDSKQKGSHVAIKVQKLANNIEDFIRDEYNILKDLTKHENIVNFYGAYCEELRESKRIWFVLELCENGPIINIVRKMIANERRMTEEHIAFILKEIIKALNHIHKMNIIHRNIRCSNILMTKNGEVKLSDFGLSCQVESPRAKRHTVIGSPSWMAPELVSAGKHVGYDNKVDVWALGITAIELADGKGPYQEMHPTRALFQIVSNPPPGVRKPSLWSLELNDFISECLEKDPENRPVSMELVEHPLISAVPEKSFHLTQELKKLIEDLDKIKLTDPKIPERIVHSGYLILEGSTKRESIEVEDLAALENLSEETILTELESKMAKGQFHSFIGDILLMLNPNADVDLYNEQYHKKYEGKSRCDNEPHIYAVADSAYQDALHHNEPQHILFTGESSSGKSGSMCYALKHLTHIGVMKNNIPEKIRRASNVIREAISAATTINANSTRAILQAQVTYGNSGKLSGAIFSVYQLEKWRIFSTDLRNGNFNLLYYFYDNLEAENKLNKLHLDKGRKYRYLKIAEEPSTGLIGARYEQNKNVQKYTELLTNLKDIGWEEEEIEVLEKLLASILILGNVRFKDSKLGVADIENPEEAEKVANILQIETNKFSWALVNYCFIDKGTALKRTHTTDEARDARDMLACTIYSRLVDWVVNNMNAKLSFGRSVYGDKYCVNLLDFFGFECFQRNTFEQLIVNTTNEQMQFLFNQRIFAWEMQEQEEEGVERTPLRFYDNKNALDQLMGRPQGLFYIIDEAARSSGGYEFIMSSIRNSSKPPFIKLSGSHEFSVAHYTGRVNYDAREMADKNKDFLPPELIEIIRCSSDHTIQQIFKNKLTKTGNLTAPSNQVLLSKNKVDKEGQQKSRKYNTASKGQYSQVHKMRTASATYRATSLELLKQLSIGPGSGGTHFVRCIRPDLNGQPFGFQPDVVRHQLRALAVLDTAKARKRGYPCRIPFAEFIRRYKFLAFDFDENVEETKDNCRLLLIRLKMEGWLLGKTRVFMKYYNVEYLQRLYELQVKKIVKIQCMMRAFLVLQRSRKNKARLEHKKQLQKQGSLIMNEAEAAIKIQTLYRGYTARKQYKPLMARSGKIDEETAAFLKTYATRWRRKSIFQVLLHYRAVRYQDLVYFTQQVHIYNQVMVEALHKTNLPVGMEKVDPHAKEKEFLGTQPLTVWKLPFRLEDLQYFDTAHMLDQSGKTIDTNAESDSENWDEPLQRRNSAPAKIKSPPSNESLINVPYTRDPSQPLKKLPEEPDSPVHTKPPTSKTSVYKKKQAPTMNYQPPTPWAAKDGDDPTPSEYRSSLRKTSFSKSSNVLNDDMPNPINELKMLARSTSNVSDADEDAPFNFQAMLKKTPRNRASMKRSGESDMCVLENRASPVKRTMLGKGPAPQPKELQRKHSADLFKLALNKSDSPDIMDFERKIYIAPGLIVEGLETEL